VLERKCTKLNWALEEANRKLRESLSEREQLASRLDSILRCLSVGVVAVDLEGRLIEFNGAASRIMGYTKDQVLGTQYMDEVGRGMDELQSPLHTMETGCPIEDQEKDVITSTGETVPVGYSTSLIRGEGGELLGAVEVFHDLRNARLLEEELLRTRTLAATGEMAAEVAMEVRNPLAGLAGFAELLARDLASDPEREKLVRKIQEGVSGVEGAISRLLENARPLPGGFCTQDLKPVVEEVLDLFESSLESARVRVERRCEETELPARLNEEQLQQAFWNILINARDAVRDDGTITVSVGRDACPTASSPFVHVVISDTGRGMASDAAERAFSPFFSTKENAAGLGLTTVRRIITAHGGEVRLESELEKGTTVTVRLPSAVVAPSL
jgi:PAS domain S-box-containing protein